MPGISARRPGRPAAAGAAEATSRAARTMAGRLAAPVLVLVILAVTAVAALLPLGTASLAPPRTAAAVEVADVLTPAGPVVAQARPEVVGPGMASGTSAVTHVRPAALAPRTGTGIAGLLLTADGTLLKPVLPSSQAPGATPVVQRHRTQRGESLWSIARDYGTDTMSLWWANMDKLWEGLDVGSVMLIPPGHGVLHKVVEGDSLASIAALYRSTPDSIIRANAMSGDVAVLGQLLLIPDGRGPSYPKGLLSIRPAAEPSRPAVARIPSQAFGGHERFGLHAGSPVDAGPDALLGDGALHYGELVQGTLTGSVMGNTSGSGTTAVKPAQGTDGPTTGTTGTTGKTGTTGATGTTRTTGGGAVAVTQGTDGSSVGAGQGQTAARDKPRYLNASPELLDSWGIKPAAGAQDQGTQIVLGDDADRASRQLEAAAAREEARANGVTQPDTTTPATPDRPVTIPKEGDPGISDADQRRVPAFDPALARLAADLLRSDLRRFPAHGSPTYPGQPDLPSSGETVYGVPTRDQLLGFRGTAAERRTGITWLSWPVAHGRITQLYTHDHHGIDIVGRSVGALIQTAAAGRIVWAGWRDNGGGYQVWVRHSAGVYTAYYHMSQLLVRPGQAVKRGKAVGVIGSTGHAFGTHLHFEMWRNGVPGSSDARVNPLRYARA